MQSAVSRCVNRRDTGESSSPRLPLLIHVLALFLALYLRLRLFLLLLLLLPLAERNGGRALTFHPGVTVQRGKSGNGLCRQKRNSCAIIRRGCTRRTSATAGVTDNVNNGTV